MSKIGKNIRKIRVVKQLSQAAFAQIFDLARPSVGAYEEGRAEPKIETVIQIAQYFGLSADALLTRELTINDLYRFDALKKNKVSGDPGMDLFKKNEILLNCALVSVNMQLEYINRYHDAVFIEGLPRFHFPGIAALDARGFEVEGDSMNFENKGIHHGDLIICQKKRDALSPLVPDQLYVLIISDKILVRRFKSDVEKISFTCDNPDWPEEEYDSGRILESWQVYAVYSRSLTPPVHFQEQIEDLEKRYRKLNNRLDEIEKKIK